MKKTRKGGKKNQKDDAKQEKAAPSWGPRNMRTGGRERFNEIGENRTKNSIKKRVDRGGGGLEERGAVLRRINYGGGSDYRTRTHGQCKRESNRSFRGGGRSKTRFRLKNIITHV